MFSLIIYELSKKKEKSHIWNSKVPFVVKVNLINNIEVNHLALYKCIYFHKVP